MSPPDTFTLAVAQPRWPPRGTARAVEDAIGLVRRAAAEGARLVLFPEAYPGPMRVGEECDPEPSMREAAVRHGTAVCWSRLEPATPEGPHRVVLHLVDARGVTLAHTARTHPATGDVHPTLNGCPVAPGEELTAVELDGVLLGLMVCSELWVPEVARILALRGAEVLLAPAGGGFGAVAGNWRLVARVRAIENLCHVALTQTRFDGEPGSALIAGPEGLVARSATHDLLVAPLDLARGRELRLRDDSMEQPKTFASLPGLLRARRPELYGELTAPRPDAYPYRAVAGGGR